MCATFEASMKDTNNITRGIGSSDWHKCDYELQKSYLAGSIAKPKWYIKYLHGPSGFSLRLQLTAEEAFRKWLAFPLRNQTVVLRAGFVLNFARREIRKQKGETQFALHLYNFQLFDCKFRRVIRVPDYIDPEFGLSRKTEQELGSSKAHKSSTQGHVVCKTAF